MPNPLCHFELMTEHPERCKAFYSALFDWAFDDQTLPGYTLINPGVEPLGGMFPKPEGATGACLNIYFQVEDVEATVVKAQQHGATVLVPTTEIPNVGWMAMIADPEGIVIGLLKPIA